MALERVKKYYRASTEDYLRFYQADWHHHMHYGFQRGLPRGGNPTENLVRYLAECLRWPKGAQVLDLGCGVGGASIWLARNRGASCAGLTLMDFQASLALGYARKAEVDGLCRFVAGDFHRPCFRRDSFDVIWAVESFDHAADKRAFLGIMAPLLRRRGQLLIADGFRAPGAFTDADETKYRKFLGGWAVPNLCTRREFEDWSARAGFAVTHHEDLTADILPHARAIFRFGLVFGPWRSMLVKLGLGTPEKAGNAWATYHQYPTLKRGLWTYDVYVLCKE